MAVKRSAIHLAVLMATACGGGGGGGDAAGDGAPGDGPADPDASPTFGDVFEGDYHLGPVDFAETQWHNSCAPYPDEIEDLTGPYLAGVDLSFNGDGSLCDACAVVTTRLGEQAVVRIVTTGVSQHAGDMDLSPEAFELIHREDPQGTPEHPRPMTWQLAVCPDTGPLYLQFQTEANPWWTSLWVRNGRRPIESVEVRSANHPDFFALRRGPDGTFNDDGGFGEGPFDLRITALGGQAVTVSQPGFEPGSLVALDEQLD